MPDTSHYLPPDARPSDLSFGTRDRFSFRWQALNMLVMVAVLAAFGAVVVAVEFAGIAYIYGPGGPSRDDRPLFLVLWLVVANGGILGLMIWFLPLVMGHTYYHTWLGRRQRPYFPADATVIPLQLRTSPRFTPLNWRSLDDAEDVGCLAIYLDRLHFHGDWIDLVIWRENIAAAPILKADRIGLWLVKNNIRIPVHRIGDLEHLEFSNVSSYTLRTFLRTSRHTRDTLTTWYASTSTPLPTNG